MLAEFEPLQFINPVEPDLPKDQDDIDILAKAKSQLGYAPDSKGWRANSFLSWLIDNGYLPFDEKTVKEYKEKKAHEAIQAYKSHEDTEALVSGLSCISFVFICVSLFAGIATYVASNTAAIVSLVVSLAVSIISLAAIKWLKKNFKKKFPNFEARPGVKVSRLEARWVMEPLSKYKKPVPPRILAEAMELKDKFQKTYYNSIMAKNLEFFIEEMVVLELTELKFDPFLVVGSGYNFEGQHRIAVWNEPGFSAKYHSAVYEAIEGK